MLKLLEELKPTDISVRRARETHLTQLARLSRQAAQFQVVIVIIAHDEVACPARLLYIRCICKLIFFHQPVQCGTDVTPHTKRNKKIVPAVEL